MIEIIDNFLSEEYYKFLYKEINSGNFAWYLSTTSQTFDTLPAGKVNILNTESRLLFHLFYYAPEQKKSFLFDYLNQFFPFMKNPDLNVVRANLITPFRFDLRHTPYHNDILFKGKVVEEGYVAIYYLHGNSTPTIFKTGFLKRKLVFPKKNRLVIFPNTIKHAHYLPVHKERMVINFNFMRKHPLK